jgi:RNA polymerase sigma factor (sigma-70 family)
MPNATANEPLAGIRLDQLSTHISTLKSAERFFARYGSALRAYLNAILRDPAAAEEVLQELVLAMLRRGGADTWPGRGRFRDYLKTAARNAAITYLRKQGRQPAAADLAVYADPRSSDDMADRELRSAWQRCVIDRANQKLESCERLSPGNLCYTVLQVVAEFQNENSPKQAEIASQRAKRVISAEAFRKQVSRARRLMAEFILNEVTRGLGEPTAADVEGELTELGLWNYVADFLPDDWRLRFFGTAAPGAP